MIDHQVAISRLHPAMAEIVFAHLANGDDVSILDSSVWIEYGQYRHNTDGPAVELLGCDPNAILSAHFNGVLVDAEILAALVRRILTGGDRTRGNAQDQPS